ncbi:MAG: ABC transporter ATP-binding protein [Bacteroidia bacterium]|nr:ABC transporter ATP-binding protein [Bacteroidia bacterium]
MKSLYTDISQSLPTHPLSRFFRLVSGERKSIFHIYFYAILAGGIGLSLPLGIQAIINLVSTGQLVTSWFVLIGLVVVGVTGGGVLQILQLTLMEAIQQRVFVKTALGLAFRLPRLDSGTAGNHYLPELVNRFFDTVTVQKGLSKILLDFSGASLQILFGLILLSFYHPFFIIFGFGLLLTVFLIIRYTGPAGLKTSLDESKYKYEVAHWLEEIGRRPNLFKSQKAGGFSLEKTDDLTLKYLGARRSHFRILLSKYSILLLFKVITITGLLLIGSLLVIENQLNLGQFVAAEIIIILIVSSVEKVILSIETIYDVLTALEKIGFITDLPLENEDQEEVKDPNRGNSLALKGLSISFAKDSRPALENINLSLDQGEKLLITGGDQEIRQIFARSLCGDFPQYAGSLSVGEIPVRMWNKDHLRQRIAIYHGPDEIIDASLLENLTLHSGPLPLSRVSEVAKWVGLSEFIENEPEGWNKEAGPAGIWLPSALKPRLILGRLILANPEIWVLCGLSMELHPEKDRQLWDKILELTAKRTLILLDSNPPQDLKFDQILEFNGSSLQKKNS